MYQIYHTLELHQPRETLERGKTPKTYFTTLVANTCTASAEYQTAYNRALLSPFPKVLRAQSSHLSYSSAETSLLNG